MIPRCLAATVAVIALLTFGGCQKKETEQKKSEAENAAKKEAAATLPAEPAGPQPNPERNAYFGEEHIHTSWSVDAWVMGNRITGPDDAYKYAQGQTIKHPMGFDIKIDTPMDFMGVTDHAEYVGVTKQANTPGSYVSKLPEAQPMIMKDPSSQAEQQKVFSYLLKLAGSAPVKAFMDPKVTSTVWKENVKIADANNHPGKFTAFCSYEWTSMPGNRNLHRNVFFRACDKVPDYPFSALDSKLPTELWNWMDGQRKAGNELLAISHNANVSDGWMYPIDVDNTTGRPIDAAWAASRDRNERLVEIKQGRDNRKRIRCCRRTTSSPATSCMRQSSVFRPTWAASTTSRAALRGRRTRTASPCRTSAVLTLTSSAWPAAPTPTTPGARTARTTSTAFTRRRMGRSSGALPASSSAAPWTCASKTPAG
jgi:hypothetical protein